MTRALLVVLSLGLGGCQLLQRGSIRGFGGAKVTGVTDSGKPATLAQDESTGALGLPAGSKLVITRFDALPGKPMTSDHPEVAAVPAHEVMEVVLSKDTQWRKDETHIRADTGSVDTSIAKHRIDVAESRYLLWASLGAVAAAGVFLWLKYPTPAMICGAAAVIFFLAWKLSDLPTYFWVIGAMGIAGAGALWLGHERGEKSAKGEAPK